MAVTENVIRLLGRYSEGLRLASEYGPRSGLVFEYAYRNTPQGNGVLGRLIDRTFLQLSTWDSIRQRIHTTKDLVREVVARRRALGKTTMIFDVASGTAPYLRQFVRESGGDDLDIVCHDRDPRQVMYGRQIASTEGLTRFTFAVGDATDEASYLTSRDPDVMLAVGLFQYLHRDAAVRSVLELTFKHLTSGGCFICTTLATPHARLCHWEADPFRPRPAIHPPAVLRGWLQAVGFVNIEQRFSQPEGFALMGWKPSVVES
jgi:SAM-dependent methyltransferase